MGTDEGGGNGAAGPLSSMGGGSLSAVCASRSSVGGFPVRGRSSDVGGASSLSMGGASSSVGYHGRVWGHIVVGRWG